MPQLKTQLQFRNQNPKITQHYSINPLYDPKQYIFQNFIQVTLYIQILSNFIRTTQNWHVYEHDQPKLSHTAQQYPPKGGAKETIAISLRPTLLYQNKILNQPEYEYKLILH